MTLNKQIILNDTIENVFSLLRTSEQLRKLFFSGNPILCSFKKYDIILEKVNINKITGNVEIINSDSTTSVKYFQINLKQLERPIPQTQIDLQIIDVSPSIIEKYQKQLQKQTKNNYKVATISAIAFVALLIPSAGIIFITTDYSVNESDILSLDEGRLYLTQQANSDERHEDARYYGEKLLYEDMHLLTQQAIANGNYEDAKYYTETLLYKEENINAVIQLREAYPYLDK